MVALLSISLITVTFCMGRFRNHDMNAEAGETVAEEKMIM
jgi:hypothetical protein